MGIMEARLHMCVKFVVVFSYVLRLKFYKFITTLEPE